jgi:hypothetical protein
MHSMSSKHIRRLVFVAVLAVGCAPGAPTASVQPSTADATPTGTPAPTTVAAASPDPTVEPTVQPDPTAGDCPTSDPLAPTEFWEAPRRCFGSDEVRILGWLDTPPIFGFLPPLIRPVWLAYPPDGTQFFTLFGTPPADPEICGGCMLLHLPPDSTIVLEGPARWVIATGHRRDPAAERCYYDEPEDWSGPEPDDASARATCRLQFVVTAVEDAPAP